MLTNKQQESLAKYLLNWTLPLEELKVIDLLPKGIPATYVYEPIKGGKQIIVANNGKFLVANSSQSLDKMIEKVKKNEYTKLN